MALAPAQHAAPSSLWQREPAARHKNDLQSSGGATKTPLTSTTRPLSSVRRTVSASPAPMPARGVGAGWRLSGLDAERALTNCCCSASTSVVRWSSSPSSVTVVIVPRRVTGAAAASDKSRPDPSWLERSSTPHSAAKSSVPEPGELRMKGTSARSSVGRAHVRLRQSKAGTGDATRLACERGRAPQQGPPDTVNAWQHRPGTNCQPGTGRRQCSEGDPPVGRGGGSRRRPEGIRRYAIGRHKPRLPLSKQQLECCTVGCDLPLQQAMRAVGVCSYVHICLQMLTCWP